MPYLISESTLKRQAKLVKHAWPFGPISLTRVQGLLCRLYGYRDYHQFRLWPNAKPLMPLNAQAVAEQYPFWVKDLADLGSMNQIQAKQLVHRLWHDYLLDHCQLGETLYGAQFEFLGDCRALVKSPVIQFNFDDRPSIKDAIESIGVPHTEVGSLLVKGEEVDFDYLMQDGDRVKVYDHQLRPSQLPYLPPLAPDQSPTFMLDGHLAGLARYLRLAGFDCLHQKQGLPKAALAHGAAAGDYVLLSRDLGLLKRACVRYGHYVQALLPEQQFYEVVRHYRLTDHFLPFSRCVKCNAHLTAIDKQELVDQVPKQVWQFYDDFNRCKGCGQLYWPGTHVEKINEVLKRAKGVKP